MNRKLYPLCENRMYLRAYKKGKSAVNKYTAVYVLKSGFKNPKTGEPVTRLGISINAKLGKACKRSRVKRIIREAYRANLDSIQKGYVIIIAARAAAFEKGVKSTEVQRQLKATLYKLEVMK